MPKNVDEDLIEETIRRVAAQRAAQADDPAAESPESAGDATPLASDEVAVSVPAPAAESEPDDAPDPAEHDDDPQPQTRLAAAMSTGQGAGHSSGPDEDAIEAAIRRVALQKAARAAEETGSLAEGIKATIASKPAPELQPTPEPAAEPVLERLEPAPLRATPRAIRREPDASPPAGEQGLADAAALLRSLVDRLDALVPALERIVSAGGVSPASRASSDPPALNDDDWEPPAISRLPSSGPPRPAIMRDPPARAAVATAAALPDIDERPLPAPLPPIQTDGRRGFDLLPRTYRVTVEDKRRGVDLVPLHRALLSMDGVKDMSLLSYNNGVAIVALETVADLEPDDLGQYVSRAMSREARVEVHNERTMVVKLSEE